MAERASSIWRDVISELHTMPPVVNGNAQSAMHARLEILLLQLHSDRAPALPRAAWERLIVVEQVRTAVTYTC